MLAVALTAMCALLTVQVAADPPNAKNDPFKQIYCFYLKGG